MSRARSARACSRRARACAASRTCRPPSISEADGIFAPRQAKHRTFYQALERHETARKAIRDKGVRTGDWRALNDEIAAAAGQLDGVRERAEGHGGRARPAGAAQAGPTDPRRDRCAGRAHRPPRPGWSRLNPTWIERLGAALERCRGAEAEAARHRLRPRPRARRSRGGAGRAGTDAPGRRDPGGLQRHQRVREGWRRPAPDRGRRPQGRTWSWSGCAPASASPDVAALEAGQPTDAARARIERLIRDQPGAERRRRAARPRPRRNLRRARSACP